MKQERLHTEMIVLCDYALIAQNNKPSVIGMFTEVGVQQFPGGMAQAVLFATLSGTPSKQYELTVKAENEHGKGIFVPLQVKVQTGPNGKNNLTITINNFVFPEAGEYEFTILNGKEEVGKTTLSVFQAKSNSATYEFKQPN